MSPAYFGELSWNEITREERVFCAELFYQIKDAPDSFVEFLKNETKLPASLSGPWDPAFEACFYRDYLHKFARTEKSKFSPKRTFDLALFSDDAIIIIEAKAAQPFTADQVRYFEKDRENISSLLDVETYFVALATKTYFDNYQRIGRGTALSPFEGRHLTWERVARKYPDAPLLRRACQVYER